MSAAFELLVKGYSQQGAEHIGYSMPVVCKDSERKSEQLQMTMDFVLQCCEHFNLTYIFFFFP